MSGTTAGANVTGTGLAGSDPSLSIRANTFSASDAPLIVLMVSFITDQ